MKKTLYMKAGTALGAFLMAAVPGQADVGIKSGFYAGASAGVSQLSGNQKFDAQDNGPPVAVLDRRDNGLSATSAGVGIFAGYGHKWNCTWVAAEVSYLFDRLNGNRTVRFNTVLADKTFQARSTGGAFGASLHLGYIPHPNWAVYAIAGLERRRFQMGLVNPSNPAADAIIALDKKYTSMAFVPGVGVLVKLAKNVSLRGEYKYALHRSKALTATANQAAANNTSNMKMNPRVQTFQVGVAYNF